MLRMHIPWLVVTAFALPVLALPAEEPLSPGEGPVLTVALAPGGEVLASAGAGRIIRVWSAVTGEELRQLQHPRGVAALVFSPNGELLASGGGDRKIRLWEPSTGKELRLFEVEAGDSFCLAFSPDSKLLAGAGATIRLWDVTSGRELRQLKGHQEPVLALVISPDGKTLASATGSGSIRLWDLENGELRRGWMQPNGVLCLAFSPDGKTLASGGGEGTVRLWNPATGEETSQLRGPVGQPCCSLAYSLDGNTLAGNGGIQGAIQRWDVASGKTLEPRKGFHGALTPVLFGPDSHGLAGERAQSLGRLWDVADLRAARPPVRVRLTSDEVRVLWHDLVSEDISLAQEAVEMLALDPARTVPFFQARLRPEPPFAPLPRLIADLDSDEFAVRQKATDELERLGKPAEKALRDCVKSKPSLEVLRRVERLLDRIEHGSCPPEQLRLLRSLDVLTRLPAPAARPLLETLAKGAPESSITQRAKAALEQEKK